MKEIMWFLRWQWRFKTVVFELPASERMSAYYAVVNNNLFGSRDSQLIRISMMKIIARAGT